MTEQHTPWELRVISPGKTGEESIYNIEPNIADNILGLSRARLIASAPELLAALGSARTHLITLGGDNRGEEWGDKMQGAILDNIDAAIAKARE